MKALILNIFTLWSVSLMADPYRTLVNSEIKQVHIRSEVEKTNAFIEYTPTHTDPLEKDINAVEGPLRADHGVITRNAPAQLGEQAGAIDRPQADPDVKIDPAQDIQSEVAAKKLKARERERYFKALQKAVEERADAAGVVVPKDLEDQLRALEARTPSTSN